MNATPFAQRNPLNAILWQFRREFYVVGLFSMVVNLLMLTPTIYMLQVFDRVLLSYSELTLLVVSLLALFFFAVMAFAEWVRSRLLVRAGVRFDALVNTRVFKASFEASLNQAGRNPREAFTDLTNLRQFMTGNGVFAFFDAPWTPIYIAVCWLLHPWLGMIAILFAVILLLLAWVGHRLTQGGHEQVAESGFKVNGFMQSKLRNVETIEAMGMLDNLRRRWANLNRQNLDVQAQAGDLAQRVQSFTKFVQLTQQSLMLGAGAWLVIRGELSPGAMIAANVLMSRALAPVQLIVASWKGFITARLSYRRLVSLLAEYPERTGLTLPDAPQGQVSLRNLQALVTGRAEPILKGINADFTAGEVLVILGPSGSGKSTLARCLMGVWPQTVGAVLLDGKALQEWDRHELGPHLGYLPQDVELLDGTIAENIARFGAIDAEKVIAAASGAGVHEMILRFPQGYDTPMGVAGGLLSGGQRQRIALARAMYGDPALIVLDEPNANLDDAGETALMQAVLKLKQQGKTVFVISHRGGIVNIADRLLVLVQGQIKLLGPRAEVLAALQPPTPTHAAPPPAAAPAASPSA
ncbi:MAG: type I secretion system permease/ATPase [Rhodocyclaceae bacterium]